jgi:Phage integrase, N-terminal SAM-like domain
VGFAEKRVGYWRGRYKLALGKYGTVSDASGVVVRFRTKREAERASYEAEAKVRTDGWRDPSRGRMLFGAYASRWYNVQDLAASTMQNYRRHIEEHLLPTFADIPVADITASDVNAWEKRERAVPYADRVSRRGAPPCISSLPTRSKTAFGTTILRPVDGVGASATDVSALGEPRNHHDRARDSADCGESGTAVGS